MICRSCLPKIGIVSQILPYLDFIEASCRKAFTMCFKDQIEVSAAQGDANMAKRQKLSETGESKVTRRSCYDTKVRFCQDQPALDLIISENFLDIACNCEDCTKTFARLRKLIAAIDNRDEALKDLENNLEGEVNPEDAVTQSCAGASAATPAGNNSPQKSSE